MKQSVKKEQDSWVYQCTYIDENYIDDSLQGEIEISSLLPLKNKLDEKKEPLLMRKDEHAMFSNNHCTDDAYDASSCNLVIADPKNVLKGDF